MWDQDWESSPESFGTGIIWTSLLQGARISNFWVWTRKVLLNPNRLWLVSLVRMPDLKESHTFAICLGLELILPGIQSMENTVPVPTQQPAMAWGQQGLSHKLEWHHPCQGATRDLPFSREFQHANTLGDGVVTVVPQWHSGWWGVMVVTTQISAANCNINWVIKRWCFSLTFSNSCDRYYHGRLHVNLLADYKCAFSDKHTIHFTLSTF